MLGRSDQAAPTEKAASSRGTVRAVSPASPPDRRARRREHTRASLVQAARTLFARQGVDNTRINEITDAADVGFGSFYNHFESKEAIHAAVFTAVFNAFGDALDRLTADHD